LLIPRQEAIISTFFRKIFSKRKDFYSLFDMLEIENKEALYFTIFTVCGLIPLGGSPQAAQGAGEIHSGGEGGECHAI